MAAAPAQTPRYEAHENPTLPASLAYGAQFSLIASATLLVTPVVVATASESGEVYLVWSVFASLVVVGLSTIIQVRRRLMRSVRQLMEGQEPPEARNGGAFRVRSLDIVLPKAVAIEDGGQEYMVSKV